MKHIYPERESKSLEFKSQLPNFKNLIKTVVAFANGIGGKIIIGVDDASRQIMGINDHIRKRIYDEFPNSVYDATTPSLLIEIYEKSFNGQSVIIIDVPNSIKKPVFITKEGTPKGIYLRAGSSTRRANKEHIEELIRESKRIHFDEDIIRESDELLSTELLKDIFKRIDKKRLVNEKILTQCYSNSNKYFPTVTGVLCFCSEPHLYIPEAKILCTRFSGIDGRDIIQREEIQGSILEQVDITFNLVKSWLQRDFKLKGTKLKGKTIIPEIAFREIIVNAIIHRQYWIPGAIKVALYDNRLEIFSPGNFPGLLDLSNIGDGTTYLRNPNLANIARRFGIIETLGTGIKLATETCIKAGIKKPEFIEGADSVKVIFYFEPSFEQQKLLNDESYLLSLFEIKDEIKLNDVITYLKVSRNTATRKLNKLIKMEKVLRKGKGPAVYYILNK